MKTSHYHYEISLYIDRIDKDNYALGYIYPATEEWKYYATKEEILAELSEHMDNMTTIKEEK